LVIKSVFKSDYIKEDETDGAGSMHGEDIKCIQFFIQETWKAGTTSR